MRSILYRLISYNLIFLDFTQKIAITAGEICLKYDIPAADSLVAGGKCQAYFARQEHLMLRVDKAYLV